jgi:hypothetical protein
MPYAQLATCHPDRRRKTAGGLCDSCYRRERYRTDPDYRRRRREQVAAWQREQEGPR